MQFGWSRLQQHGPRLVSLMLAVLIAEESVRAAVAVMGGYRWKPPPATIDHPFQPRASTLDVPRLRAMHLFGDAAPAADPQNAPVSTANVTLVGTLATQNPANGFAIMAATAGAKVYKVGDDVDGAALHAVYANRVTLERGGNFETVLLRRFEPASTDAARVQRTAMTAAIPAPESGPQHLGDVIQADPSTDDASDKLLGFRIRPGNARSAFFHAGLRPGDLITGVNGTPLTDQNRNSSQAAMASLLASGSATVSIMRAGKPLEVSLDLEQ